MMKFKVGDKIVGKTKHGTNLSSVYKETPYFIPTAIDTVDNYIVLKDRIYSFNCIPEDIRHYSEFEDDYQNVLDVEVGDIVRCISENKSKFKDYAGGGWEEGLEFKVSRVSNHYDYKLYFGGKNGYGVYSDAIRLVKKFNPLKWEKGAYVRYKGTKKGNKENWERICEPKGIKIGDVAIINYIFSDGDINIIDPECSRATLLFCKDDLELINKEEYNVALKNKDTMEITNLAGEPKLFVLGNWYKFTWERGTSAYAKCDKIENDFMHFKEVISKSGFEKFQHTIRESKWNIKRPTSIVHTDLKEIIPYIVVETMKKESNDTSAFILGQWYKIIWYKYPLIERYGHTCYIKIKGIDYKKNVIYFEEGIIKDKYGKFLGEIDIADAFITEANYEAEYLNDFILDLVLNKPLTPKDVFKKDDTPIAMGKGILNQVELNNEPTEKYKGKSKNSKQYNLIIIKVSKEKLIKK